MGFHLTLVTMVFIKKQAVEVVEQLLVWGGIRIEMIWSLENYTQRGETKSL